MRSRFYLAILRQEYQQATAHALQLVKRYEQKQAWDKYLVMLHLTGQGKKAWGSNLDLTYKTLKKKMLLI